MEGTLRCTVRLQAQHAHSLEDNTWPIQQSTSSPPPTLNTSITFNNKMATAPKHIANYFTKQFINTQYKQIHSQSNTYNTISLTTTQVHETVKQSKITTQKFMTN